MRACVCMCLVEREGVHRGVTSHEVGMSLGRTVFYLNHDIGGCLLFECFSNVVMSVHTFSHAFTHCVHLFVETHADCSRACQKEHWKSGECPSPVTHTCACMVSSHVHDGTVCYITMAWLFMKSCVDTQSMCSHH